ncbi:MAG: hypothetical protein MR210_09640 [Erysipelotrichaceae bacterium]|nr:hypothetical protein [Erysipelotrichaceae bacterium]MDY5251534.1 hypothetical protein [Erysipelotrichaceae bacterium]
MKEILLSFRPAHFKPLLFGIKKYEYRKRFCDEETKAYLYLSGKSRQVIGIMELGRPIRLDLTKDDYLNYPETLNRVEKYILNQDIHAIPIKSLTLFENPLTLSAIRKAIPNFMPPQLYFVLDNHPRLQTILRNQPLAKKLFYHQHDKIYYDNLAMSVSEIEKTANFKKLSSENMHNDDFKKLIY